MLKEKAGVIAGQIWNALNGTEGLTHKQIKKATKLVDKDFFLGLGWLLREDKVATSEVEGELFVKLSSVFILYWDAITGGALFLPAVKAA